MAQLTWRAVLIGSCLGGVLSLTNLYIGLKAGWGFGVAITASILSYRSGKLAQGRPRAHANEQGVNNCMQSTASSAGYSTGGTLVSAFPAYIIVNHQSMSVPLMLPGCSFRPCCRGHDGHPHEAADDQYRAVALPFRHRGG